MKKSFTLFSLFCFGLILFGTASELLAQTLTFSYTGSVQSYTVPAGVFTVSLDVQGAKGGNSSGGDLGGNGGRVTCSLTVTPGQVLKIYAGGMGDDHGSFSGTGFNGGGIGNIFGGGGGGASDVRLGTIALSNRVVIAGGGGGGAADCGEVGGAGGGTTGGNGIDCGSNNTALNGQGGTASAGGSRATTGGATSGALGLGGDADCCNSGSGGGGGYYGGGGGYSGSGGGGSSFSHATLATSVTHTQGYNSGNGVVYLTPICTPGTITGTTTKCEGTSTTLADAISGGIWTSSNTSVATIGTGTGLVSGLTAGTTTISYSFAAGCSATTLFTVNTTPVAIGGTTTICTGVSSTLTNAVSGGTWTSVNTAVATINSSTGDLTGVAVGTTTISYVLSTGCFTTTVARVNQTPVAITGSTSVCEGATVTYTDATAGGNWTSTDPSVATIGLGTGLITGVAAGTATISYTIPATGCYTIQDITVNITPAAIAGTFTICSGVTTTLTDGTGGGTWASASTGVATINSSTGDLTGVSAGTATISYVLSTGCYAVAVETINQTPVAITGSTTVCEGATVTYTDATTGGDWTSTDPSVATIGLGTGLVTGIAAGTATISYTIPATGCYTIQDITVNITPAAIAGTFTICSGVTTTLTDGTGGGTWASASTGVATINSSTGDLTGVSAGTATISYVLSTGCYAVAVETINQTPVAITGSTSVCEGATVLYTDATAGGDWTSTDLSVATIGLGTGLVTGIAAGTATISYSIPATGCYTTQDITVNITPAAIAGTFTICSGVTTTLTDGTGGGTWASESTGVATINSSTGDLTGVSAGTSIISYVLSTGCYAVAVETINETPVAITGSTTVCEGATVNYTDATTGGDWTSTDPSVATIGLGTGLVTGIAAGTATISYTIPATGCYTTQDITVNITPAAIAGTFTICSGVTTTLTDGTGGGTWASASTGVATINSSTGDLTGVSAGTATISYVLSTGCYAVAVETINQTPVAITGSTTVCEGATVTYTDATAGGDWTSTDPSVATIGLGTGLITGIAAGTATISYTIPATGCYATQDITVNITPAAIAGTFTICSGVTTTLTDGTGGGTWASASTGVATINSSTGDLTGVSAGTATISYVLSTGCYAVAVETINQTPVAITGSTTVCEGATVTYTDATAGGDWTSTDPSVATIGLGTGLVTGIAAGTATISYTIPATGCYTTQDITVNITPAAIAGTFTICSGVTTTLTDGTSGGTWASANTSVATINSSTGDLTGVTAGTATISYVLSTGCYALAVETIDQTPVAITGNTNVCLGIDNTLSNATIGGSWSSDDAAVATVVAGTGLVSGVSAGTTLISYTMITGCAASIVVTVNITPAAIGGTTTLCSGDITTLTDATSGGNWSSTNTSVATISAGTGDLVAVSAGTTTISYTMATGCNATTLFTVNLTPVAITGSLNVCTGVTNTLSDATAGGTWSSSDEAIATVGSLTGIVSGVTTGTATISYVMPTGCYAVTVVDVNVSPAAITGTTSICALSSTTLSSATLGGIWSSSNNTVATIGSSTGDVNGLVGGTTNITYTLSSGCIATTVVGVTGSPVVTSLSASVGFPSSTITIGGSNFATSSVNDIVYFGATQATVSGGSTTSITVTVPYGATYMPVSVENSTCTLTGYSHYPFLQNYDNSTYVSGSINFDTYVDFATGGSNPYRIAFGDIDGDGKADMIVSNGSSNSISVYQNTSTSGSITSGSFGSPVDFTTATGAIDVTVGDIDGDGKLDIATVGSGSAVVSVFRNTATVGTIDGSSLDTRVDFTTGTTPSGVKIGDLDKDGKPELVVVNRTSASVSVFHNTSVSGVINSGSFASRVDFTTAANASAVSLGDIDGDGKTDIVTANFNSNSISVLRNTSSVGVINSGSIAAKVDFTAGSFTNDVTLSDIDGDGKPEVITANLGGNSVSVFRNTATSGVINSGSLATKVDFTSGTGPKGVAIADIDGDGKPDIITSNSSASTASIFRNTATSGTINSASLATKADFTTNSGPLGVAAGDIDGDGLSDVAVVTFSSGNVSILRNEPIPNIAPITGTLTVCEASTTTLSDAAVGGFWTSSNPAVATVGSTSGIVSGVSAGTVTITYTLGLGTSLATVTVNPLPAAITGTTNYCEGLTSTLADASAGGTWSSSDLAVTTIGSSSGIATGVVAGTATITYDILGCLATTQVTVNPVPAAITGNAPVCVGLSVTLADITVGGTWESSNTAVATIGSLTGIMTGVSNGTATITYKLATGCLATLQGTVNANPAIITGNASVCVGLTTTLADATTGGNFSSSNVAVATINAISGLLSGVSAGTATITYTLGTGCIATRIETVNPLPAAITGNTAVCVGLTTTLADATGTGNFSSSNGAVATINAVSGLLTGVGAGTATITYTLATGCIATRQQTVNPNPAVIGGAAAVCVGSTTTLTDATLGGTWLSSTTAIATIGSLTALVNGVSAGTTTISYVLPTGCLITRVETVSGLPSAITGVTNVCTTLTTTLSSLPGGGNWSSSNGAVATVGALTGVVTGIGAGTATITYTLGTGCTVTTQITVNVTPNVIGGAAAVCVGLTTTLNDLPAGGTWISSTVGVATIGSLTALVTGVSAGTTTISYVMPSGCMATRVETINANPSAITGITTVCTGFTTTLSSLPGGGNWTSSNGAVATVGALTGVVTGVGAGTATMTYTLGTGCIATTQYTVNVTPNVIGGAAAVCVGLTTTLNDLPAGGTWISSTIGVATIGSLTALVTGVSAGTTTISYVLPTGCLATRVETINANPSAITGITNVCTGFTTTLGSLPGGGNWTSSNGAVATVGALTGVVTGVSAGTATVTYTLGTGCIATTQVTVNVTPNVIGGVAAICVGLTTTLNDLPAGGTWLSTNTAVATIGSLTALVTGITSGTSTISYILPTGCFATRVETINANPSAITGGTTVCTGSNITLGSLPGGGNWTSSNVAVATVGALTGVVNGVSVGTASITYTLGTGCIATTQVTVNSTPVAITGPTVGCTGNTIALTNLSGGGTWSSSNIAVATIGSISGIVNGITVGTTTISYIVGSGCFVTVVENITQTPVAITGVTTVCTGSTTTLSDLTPGGIYTTSNGAVATVVGATGVVTGVTAGTATITYTLGTCFAVTNVTVNQTPGAILPAGPVSVCEGSTTTLTDPSPGGTWSSSSIANATVGGTTGIVTGVLAGVVNIIYINAAGCFVQKAITVNLTPVAILPAAPSVCPGTSTTLTDASGGGGWTSANSLIATINAVSGLATGVTAGTTTMTYTIGTCFNTTTILVNPLPNAGVVSGPATGCTGSSYTFTDASPGGLWSSSDITVATAVAGTGLVTGIAAGTASIIYSVTNVCGTATASSIIEFFVPPSAGTITGPSLLCAGTFTYLVDTNSGGVWSATNLNANAMAGGIVVGVTPGIDTILYSVTNGCGTATDSFVMTIGTYLSAGTISGPSSVCTGSSITLTDPVPFGAWTSSSAHATVTGGVITGVSVGTAIISYSVSSACGTAVATHMVTINLTPDAGSISGPSTLCTGSSALFTDPIVGGVWSSSGFSASITAGGMVTGVTPGIDTIKYTVTNVCGTAVATSVLTLGTPPYTGVISGPTVVCPGATITLAETTTGGDWSSSTGNASVTTGGDVTGISAGTTTISYSFTSACGVVAATYDITINPSPDAGIVSGPASICTGFTSTFSSTVTGGVWSSATTSIATIGSISGIVNGVSSGSDNIFYTVTNSCGSSISSASITILPLPFAGSITGPTTVCVGSTITLADAAPGGIWTSIDTSIGTINPLTGLFTARAAGTDVVNYSVSNSCGSAAVMASITVNPLPNAGTITGPSSVCIGSSITLTDLASGGVWTASNTNASVSITGVVTGSSLGIDTIYYSVTNSCGTATAFAIININTAPTVGVISGPSSLCVSTSVNYTNPISGGLWSSTDITIATIVATTGTATGVAAGTDVINYTVTNACGTAVASKTITVETVPVAGSISGPSSVCEGATITLVDATTGGIWSASNTNATISSAGVVTGITSGFVTISYTVTNSCTSISATTLITINAAPNPGVITGPSSLCLGTTITLTDAVPGGIWSASNARATVVGGVVTAVTAGIDTIMYSVTNGCGTATASWPVTINSLPDAGTILGPSGVCIGSTITLTNSVAGGVWSASNGRATILGGVVTGVSAGTDTIIYSTTGACGSASATKIINVAPIPSGGTLSGLSSVCVGGTITLTSTVSGGVWTRTNSRASVSSTGVVTGLAIGRDTIIYTVTNSCGSGISSKTITVTGAGTAGTILGQSNVCQGENIILTDAIPGGSWTTTNPLIAVVDGSGRVTGVAVGSVTIDYTVSGTCGSAVATHGVIVRSQVDCGGGSTGISQTVNAENEIRIAPNPSNGEFTIKGSFAVTGNEDVIIEITNMLGQTIYTGKVATHAGVIDEQVQLSNPTNGMYLLSLRSGDAKQVFHVVITR